MVAQRSTCIKCGTEVVLNTNCRNCGWWYGYYKFVLEDFPALKKKEDKE